MQIVAPLEGLLQHEFVSQVLSKVSMGLLVTPRPLPPSCYANACVLAQSSATFDVVLLEKAKELMTQGSGI